ncbi:hypothetical protein M441DRAFT_31235 [Trichoderma asperellum CBS 433.97]|uniref:Uncharacterized protein n=1 Tax=Trichoderma asperellum (strain ATCC 204424 / CBS 433.97 / NBRC 101777) TaxID=1042311 RepID=A0A2T3YUA6_TRIA4|nr:hypothetical protein M441DRAFT_31235 [Trichoderma asperellum CBS 433.97]PTB36086.1 hypothetical protein M441DRAFT_31235 [Trichoderma asperellum CBS 433.97]
MGPETMSASSSVSGVAAGQLDGAVVGDTDEHVDDDDAAVKPEVGGAGTGRWGLIGGGCVVVAVRSTRMLVRFEGVRRPNTQDTLARMHRWQAFAPADTEHLSFWTRQRSHDMRRDRSELSLQRMSTLGSIWGDVVAVVDGSRTLIIAVKASHEVPLLAPWPSAGNGFYIDSWQDRVS